MIQPYEFNQIKIQITHLINVYKTVSDTQVVATNQHLVAQVIVPLLGETLHEEIKPVYMDKTLTNAKAVALFDRLKQEVEPFPTISDKQIQKLFRKVKKMPYPKTTGDELKDVNYLAWDDIGAQRRYLSFMKDNRLVGLYGVLSTDVIKNVCSICHKIDAVTLFLSTTKSAGDGTYTKKGNYICKDHAKCNQQMEDLTHLYAFYETLSK